MLQHDIERICNAINPLIPTMQTKVNCVIKDAVKNHLSTVFTDGNLQYSQLTREERKNITALMIELDDRDLFSIYEHRNYDEIVTNIIKVIVDSSVQNQKDLTKSITENVMEYYQARIQDLLDLNVAEFILNEECLQMQGGYDEDYGN